MWPTILLAFVIAIAGAATIGAGVWALYILLTEKTVRVPSRYYAIAIGLISGGLGLVGLAQALRLLVVISGAGAGQWAE
jgi:hypothetical protein